MTTTPQQASLALTDEQIDLIAADGMRNAAGGIYATSVHQFARACIAEATQELQAHITSLSREAWEWSKALEAVTSRQQPRNIIALPPLPLAGEFIPQSNKRSVLLFTADQMHEYARQAVYEAEDAWQARAASGEAARVPEGFVLVPVHMTDEMLLAGKKAVHNCKSASDKVLSVYKSCIAAAPKAPASASLTATTGAAPVVAAEPASAEVAPEFTSLCGRVTLSGPREDVEHLVRLLPEAGDSAGKMTGEREAELWTAGFKAANVRWAGNLDENTQVVTVQAHNNALRRLSAEPAHTRVRARHRTGPGVRRLRHRCGAGGHRRRRLKCNPPTKT